MSGPESRTRRLLALSEALGHLAEPRCADETELTRDPMLRAAVERWIQVAVEACVDLAAAEVARGEWTPPASARETFGVLARHDRLPRDLAVRLGAAAGLRNVLVHDYADVDLGRLARIVGEDLDDLRRFAGVAAAWIDDRGDGGPPAAS